MVGCVLCQLITASAVGVVQVFSVLNGTSSPEGGGEGVAWLAAGSLDGAMFSIMAGLIDSAVQSTVRPCLPAAWLC